MKTLAKLLAILFMLLSTIFTAHSQTWVQMNSGVTTAFCGIRSLDNLNAVVVGEAGVVLKTTDGGNTWIQKVSNTTKYLRSLSFPNASTGYAAGNNGTVIKTTDGGNTWTVLTTGSTANWYSIFFVSANIGYVAGADGEMMKTTDGGNTWTGLATFYGNDNINTIYFIDANTGWIAGDTHDRIKKTTNGGTTWSLYLTNVFDATYGLYFANANTGILVNPGNIVRTTNGCTSFTTVNPTGSGSVCFSSSLLGWAAGQGGSILKTTDGGANWGEQIVGTTNFFDIHFSSSSIGYAVGNNGAIYKYVQSYPVTFHVKDNLNASIQGASVTFNGSTQATNVSGNATLGYTVAGTYNYTVSKSGYTTYSSSVVEPGNDPVQVTLQQSGYTVNFFIKDNTNFPLMNANVTFKSQTYTTDVNGMVSFTAVPAGLNNTYSVTKAGYTTVSGSVDVSSNITISLTMPTAAANTYDITFHVTNNVNSDLQGASITFNGSTKTADATGQAVFNGISSGIKSYAVNLSGYDAVNSSMNVSGNHTENVTLTPAAASNSVDFYVYDNSSNPIAGAAVVFDGVTHYTGTLGLTIFTNVSAGNIHYTITASGYISVDNYINEPGNGYVYVAMTPVSSGSNIDFYVYDNSSNAINAAQVTFNGVTQFTNVSGYTLFSNVPAGNINYEVVKAGFITSSASVLEPGTNPVNVYMTAAGSGLTINFYVYRPGLWGIDGATVTFNGVTQYTDASGNTAFNDVPTGNLYYEISKPGYVSVSNYISEPGNDPIALILNPSVADINFWVYDNLTNPIDGATVSFDGVTQTTDASGNTVFSNVATGNLYYEVTKAGYNSYATYVDEPGNDPIVVTLSQTGGTYNVTFDVNDISGNPVQNATVTFNLTDQLTVSDGSTLYSGIAESDNYWYNVIKSGFILSTGSINVHSNITESVVLFADASGLNEIKPSVSISTYPNPVNDFVEISSTEKITSISIYNSNGIEIVNCKPDNIKAKLNLGNYASGLYIINITTLNNVLSKKIIRN